jgi:hypothetical protein
MELEAEVQKLKEQNEELQKKQVCTISVQLKSIFCYLSERDSERICIFGPMLMEAVISQILVK